MPKMIINDQEITVEDGLTVIQACEIAGVDVPRFCYHERLSIAGNCRMCLVEMDKSPKPIASCAMPVSEGMIIKTNSPMVQKAREGVMEFLLINHPLDCPICDQGGECDLQDQAISFGRDRNRFKENKRAVSNKEIGPLISTTMTRCIHCTRCVRFAQDVAGISELGATGRGEDMEIDTYVKSTISSEISGNIIDLCPVGALTSKPYAFEARSWELQKTETIDVFDALGSNIRVDTRGREVKRVLPRLNENVNEEWISDKTRFAYDGLNKNRLDRPWVKKNNKLVEATWDEAFRSIQDKIAGINGNRIAAIAGNLADCESMFALKKLMAKFNSPNLDCRQDGSKLNHNVRSSYLFNSQISGIDKSDYIFLIGCDPRWEAPILNARIRKRFLAGGLEVAVLGTLPERLNGLTYPYIDLGNDPSVLSKILSNEHEISKKLQNADAPMIILGQSALIRDDADAILSVLHKISNTMSVVKNDWNGFNVLHTAASRVGGLEIGFVPELNGLNVEQILNESQNGNIDLVYLLGADELDFDLLTKTFVIYQGHHGDAGAKIADVILPGAAYSEKDGTYINTEGRVQRAARATFPPNLAREDWSIIRALSEVLKVPLSFNTITELHNEMEKVSPVFSMLNEILPAQWESFGVEGPIKSASLKLPVKDFYCTDSISRASETMNVCSKTFVNTVNMEL